MPFRVNRKGKKLTKQRTRDLKPGDVTQLKRGVEDLTVAYIGRTLEGKDLFANRRTRDSVAIIIASQLGIYKDMITPFGGSQRRIYSPSGVNYPEENSIYTTIDFILKQVKL